MLTPKHTYQIYFASRNTIEQQIEWTQNVISNAHTHTRTAWHNFANTIFVTIAQNKFFILNKKYLNLTAIPIADSLRIKIWSARFPEPSNINEKYKIAAQGRSDDMQKYKFVNLLRILN